MAPALHPDIEHLAFLLGTWRGTGQGEYPTIEPFEFTEETVFAHAGKPFITFVQRTKNSSGEPLHTESGYLRPVGPNGLEFVLTMPSGIFESLEGTIDGRRLQFGSVVVTTTATAKEVTATSRTYDVENDRLTWTFAMAAVGQPLQHHLRGVLDRVPDSGG